MNTPSYEDFGKGDWICAEQQWRPFGHDEKLDGPFIEAEFSEYGCETGCTGYRFYVRTNGVDGQELRFEFCSAEEAATIAAKYAAERGGIPFVVRRDEDYSQE